MRRIRRVTRRERARSPAIGDAGGAPRWAVLANAGGEAEEVAGRGTEVFVRRNGRWIHTGWHLDAVADEEPART